MQVVILSHYVPSYPQVRTRQSLHKRRNTTAISVFKHILHCLTVASEVLAGHIGAQPVACVGTTAHVDHCHQAA